LNRRLSLWLTHPHNHALHCYVDLYVGHVRAVNVRPRSFRDNDLPLNYRFTLLDISRHNVFFFIFCHLVVVYVVQHRSNLLMPI
jgi:hypothetical protein